MPAYLAPPSIDPLSDKNRELDEAEVEALLEPFDLPHETPLVTQVSRFDRLKDPLGVIDAFALARRRERAHLVLAGGTADDDPEGAEVLAEMRERAGDRRRRQRSWRCRPTRTSSSTRSSAARPWWCRSRCARASR